MSKTTQFVNLLTFTHLEITLLKVPHLYRFFPRLRNRMTAYILIVVVVLL